MQNVFPKENAHTSSKLAAGQMLGDCFHLKSELCRVAHTWEWLAHDEVSGREVVLHFLSTPDLTPLEKQALQYSVKRLRMLIHPHIQRVHGLFEQADLLAVVTDPVPPTALMQSLEEKEVFQPEEIVPWVAHLGETLDDAHQLHFAHGALCLSDLYVNSDGSLLVANFGWSRLLRISSATTAPEPPDDVFAFGQVIYTLLTGESPLHTAGYRSINEARAHAGKSPVPEGWDRMVAACMEPRAHDRPQTCSAALAFLEDSSGTQQVMADLMEEAADENVLAEVAAQSNSTPADRSVDLARAGIRSTSIASPSSAWKPIYMASHMGTLERPRSRVPLIALAAAAVLGVAAWCSKAVWWPAPTSVPVVSKFHTKPIDASIIAAAETLPPPVAVGPDSVETDEEDQQALENGIQTNQAQATDTGDTNRTAGLKQELEGLNLRIERLQTALEALDALPEFQGESIIREITAARETAHRERAYILLEIERLANATRSRLGPENNAGNRAAATGADSLAQREREGSN